MRSELTKEFILDKYTVSETAKRKGYTEQYKPPKDIVQDLEAVHNAIIVPLINSGVLRGKLYCNSAYRCGRVNYSVGGAVNSQHLYGQAMDLEYYEDDKEQNLILHDAIKSLDLPFDQMIREFGTVSNPAWIHVSHKKDGNNRKQCLIK